jgi:PAS domain S-box-containing protein
MVRTEPTETQRQESVTSKDMDAKAASAQASRFAVELSKIAESISDLASRIDSEHSVSEDATSDFAELYREMSEQREAYLRAEVQLADLRLQLAGEQSRCERVENDLIQLRTALETMQLGVTIANQDGIITYVNPADAKMHGYTRDELLGKDVGTYAVGFQHKPVSAERLRKFTSYQRETFNRRKDGSILRVRLLSDVVWNSDGDPVGLVTMCEELPSLDTADKSVEETAKNKSGPRKAKKS